MVSWRSCIRCARRSPGAWAILGIWHSWRKSRRRKRGRNSCSSTRCTRPNRSHRWKTPRIFPPPAGLSIPYIYALKTSRSFRFSMPPCKTISPNSPPNSASATTALTRLSAMQSSRPSWRYCASFSRWNIPRSALRNFWSLRVVRARAWRSLRCGVHDRKRSPAGTPSMTRKSKTTRLPFTRGCSFYVMSNSAPRSSVRWQRE